MSSARDLPLNLQLHARFDCGDRVVTLLVDGEGGSSTAEEGGGGSASVPDFSQWQQRLFIWRGEGERL